MQGGKVTKYHIDAPLYATTFAFVFSPTTYSQMSAAQKRRSTITAPMNGIAGRRASGRFQTHADAVMKELKESLAKFNSAY